jgi:hypothetical protein
VGGEVFLQRLTKPDTLRHMHCPDNNRLRQRYEAAILHWGHVILFSDTDSLGALIPRAAEVKQKAYTERDAAKKRLSDHVLSCPTCNPKLGVTRRIIN